jgi:hypothetical protein
MFWRASGIDEGDKDSTGIAVPKYASSCSSGNSSTRCLPLSTRRQRESLSTRRVFKLLNVLNILRHSRSISTCTSTDSILLYPDVRECDAPPQSFSLGNFRTRGTEETCRSRYHQSTVMERAYNFAPDQATLWVKHQMNPVFEKFKLGRVELEVL